MDLIKKYIFSQIAQQKLNPGDAKLLLNEIKNAQEAETKDDIAVLGMALRIPGASSPEEFWDILQKGDISIDKFPQKRREDIDISLLDSTLVKTLTGHDLRDELQADPLYLKGGFLKRIDNFDWEFFNMSYEQALYMDPMQRICLEIAYEAVEDGGYGGKKIYNTRTGVFVGKDNSTESFYKYLFGEPNEYSSASSPNGLMASRISYCFNLKGPAVVLDTACSSGLVALHHACRSLQSGECDMAIAAGIHINYKPISNPFIEGITSPSGILRSYDKNADGTVWGEGFAVVFLKPLKKALKDGDSIYGVIKGSCVNNDGTSVNISTPNIEAQQGVIEGAWKDAGISPETISYIDGHGSGTEFGDLFEVKAISEAFRKYTKNEKFCGLSTFKPNIGHVVVSSGIISVIKVLLSLKYEEVPKLHNFKEHNNYLDFSNLPVYIVEKNMPWKKGNTPRRAGVNSFSVTGTNCHVVIEEAPVSDKEEVKTLSGVTTDLSGGSEKVCLHVKMPRKVLTVSAKSKTALLQFIRKYQKYFNDYPDVDIDDVCYTANTGKFHLDFRVAFAFYTVSELMEIIKLIKNINFEEITEKGFYYGESTKDSRSVISKGTNKKANDLLTEDMSQDTVVDELLKAYVNGCEIQWDMHYRQTRHNHVNVPVYPYERRRLWIEGLTEEEKQNHDFWQNIFYDKDIKKDEETNNGFLPHIPYKIREKEYILQKDFVKKVEDISSELDVEKDMLILLGLGIAFSKNMGQNEFTAGISDMNNVCSNDDYCILENLIPLRIRYDGMKVIDRAKTLIGQKEEAISHKRYQFSKLKSKASNGKLFDFVFSYDTSSQNKCNSCLRYLGQCNMEKLDLAISMIKTDQEINVKAVYNGNLHSEESINQLIKNLEYIINEVSRSKELLIDEIDPLGIHEKLQNMVNEEVEFDF